MNERWTYEFAFKIEKPPTKMNKIYFHRIWTEIIPTWKLMKTDPHRHQYGDRPPPPLYRQSIEYSQQYKLPPSQAWTWHHPAHNKLQPLTSTPSVEFAFRSKTASGGARGATVNDHVCRGKFAPRTNTVMEKEQKNEVQGDTNCPEQAKVEDRFGSA